TACRRAPTREGTVPEFRGGRDAFEGLSLRLVSIAAPMEPRPDARPRRAGVPRVHGRGGLRPAARPDQPRAGAGAVEALLRGPEPERLVPRPRILHGQTDHRL